MMETPSRGRLRTISSAVRIFPARISGRYCFTRLMGKANPTPANWAAPNWPVGVRMAVLMPMTSPRELRRGPRSCRG